MIGWMLPVTYGKLPVCSPASFRLLEALAAENPETTPQDNPTAMIRPELSCQSGLAAADAATSHRRPRHDSVEDGPRILLGAANESICS